MQRLSSAKIQVRAIFFMEDMLKNCSPKFKLYEDAMQVHIQMGTNMAAGNQQKHQSVTEFCFKSVNLSLEELKNAVTIVFF